MSLAEVTTKTIFLINIQNFKNPLTLEPQRQAAEEDSTQINLK